MGNREGESRVIQALKAISLETVISGFHTYWITWKTVLRAPRSYVKMELTPWKPEMLQSAIVTYLYGLASSFILYIPFILKHNLSIDKTKFFLQFAYSQMLLVCLVYLSAKVFRGRGTLAQTATVYCTWTGIASPIFLLLTYPVFFYIPIENFIVPPQSNDELPPWTLWWVASVFIVMLIVGAFSMFQWIADVHNITKKRLLLAMLLVYFPLMLLHNTFIAPYVQKGLNAFSLFLQKIL